LSSRQFWDLMQSWRVPDATALELIEFPGKLGASGKRPRFRFTTRQRRTTSYLAEINAMLDAVAQSPDWLHRKIGAAPFPRHSPVQHMAALGQSGAVDVLRLLTRTAMRASVQR